MTELAPPQVYASARIKMIEDADMLRQLKTEKPVIEICTDSGCTWLTIPQAAGVGSIARGAQQRRDLIDAGLVKPDEVVPLPAQLMLSCQTMMQLVGATPGYCVDSLISALCGMLGSYEDQAEVARIVEKLHELMPRMIEVARQAARNDADGSA